MERNQRMVPEVVVDRLVAAARKLVPNADIRMLRTSCYEIAVAVVSGDITSEAAVRRACRAAKKTLS